VFFFLGFFLRAPFVGAFFVDDNVIWSINESPIIIQENVIISELGSLTIEPGVQVIFDADIGIEVIGRLNILGIEENPIILGSEDNHWKGISVYGENAQVTLKYVVMENALHALLIENSSILLENIQFRNNIDSIVTQNSDIIIRNSLFENNDLVINSTESNFSFEENSFIDNSTLGYIDFDTHIEAQNNMLSGGDIPALIMSIPDYDNHNPFNKEIKGDIPFYFQESLIIPSGSSVNILEGVQLFFDASVGITVLGDFSLEGNKSNPVIMASSARLLNQDLSDFSMWNTWQGITFIPTESHEYTMSYGNFFDVQSGIFLMGTILNVQHFSLNRSVGFIADTAVLNIDNLDSENSIYESIVGYNASSVTLSNVTLRKTSLDNRDTVVIFGDTSFVGDFLQIYTNSGSAISLFDNALMNISNSFFSGNNQNTSDLINIFNSSNAVFKNVTVQDGKSSGVVGFNDVDVQIENSQIKNMDSSGVWIFDGEDIPVSQISILDSTMQNNSVGISVIRSIAFLRDSIISGNSNFGAYIESGLGTIDAKENNWGMVSGPFHEIKNQQGRGDTISNYVQFVPWIGYDPLLHGLIDDIWDDEIIEEEIPVEEDIPPVTQQSFWSPVTNFPGGIITMRKEPSLSGKAIKTLPNDWVIYVQAVQVQDTQVIADGYHWFFVRDATDDVTGWIPGKTVDGSVEFLPFISNKQDEFEYTASHIFSTKAERAEKIIEIINHYYNNTDTKKSLYSGKDNQGKKITLLKERNFPFELILAIAIQESHTVNFDNMHVSHDYGHGIMQITFKALWNEPNNWIKNDWDNRGVYSKYFNSLCRSYDPSRKSGGQGLLDYFDCYLHAGTGNNLVKSYKHYKENFSNSTYKQYTNTQQSMYANLKDGMGVLSLKHPTRCPRESKEINGLLFTCHDIERLLAVWWYNGESFDVKKNYMKEVSQKLKTVGSHFLNVSYNNTDNLIEKLIIANNNRNSIKVFSPVEFFVKDSQGNITGSKKDIELEDIPHSGYSSIDESVVVFFSEDNLTYELIGTDNATYGITIESVVNGKETVFQGINIPTTIGERHVFEIDWDIVAVGGNGVKVSIDKDADDIFEEIVYISNFIEGDFPQDADIKVVLEQKQSFTGGLIRLSQEEIKDDFLEIFQKIIVNDETVEIFNQNMLQSFTDFIKPITIAVELSHVDNNADEVIIKKEIDNIHIQARADNIPIQKKSIFLVGGLIFMVLTFIGIRKKMYL